jgi:hypothetical protein
MGLLFNLEKWYPQTMLTSDQLNDLVPDNLRDAPYVPATQPAQMPDKIFIEKEGNLGYEYSDEPPSVVARLYDALNGFYSAQNYIELFYSVPEVFAPIHEIASRVADATWQLRKDFNDNVDYNNTTFNRLFTQPNPFVSMREFVYIAVAFEILTGKQLWFLNKTIDLSDGPEDVVNWFNLPGHQARIHMKKNIDPYSALTTADVVDKYTVPGYNGRDREFKSKDVLTCLNLNMKRGYDLNDCVPLIKGADKPIRNLIPVYEARGIIYIKRGALGFLVSKAKDTSGTIPLSDTEKKELESEHQKTYGVTGNKRPFGISSANVDFVRTAMSIEELQPFEETLHDAMAIYSVLRVPPHLVPNPKKSTFNNADADMKAFYTNVIVPWANKYAQIWTTGMRWPERRRYIYPDYSHIDVLQENKKEKADVDDINTRTYLSQYKEGLITKNGLLAALGKDGIGPDGDKYVTDTANPEPFALQAQVGTLTALQMIIGDALIGEEAKKNILVIVFGFSEADAAKMVIAPPKPEPIKTENNGGSQEGIGTEDKGSSNQLP